MEIIDHRDVSFASGAFTSLCSGGLRLQPGEMTRVKEARFEKCPKDPFFFPLARFSTFQQDLMETY